MRDIGNNMNILIINEMAKDKFKERSKTTSWSDHMYDLVDLVNDKSLPYVVTDTRNGIGDPQKAYIVEFTASRRGLMELIDIYNSISGINTHEVELNIKAIHTNKTNVVTFIIQLQTADTHEFYEIHKKFTYAVKRNVATNLG